LTAGGGRFSGARFVRTWWRGRHAADDDRSPRADPSAELPGAYRHTQAGRVVAVATAPGLAAAAALVTLSLAPALRQAIDARRPAMRPERGAGG